MKLDEIVTWYQKKIGTYDKQQWEKTVEQKILDGFNSVTLKTAKLKTELIDVDLVRGSTFPKAKPKQSLLTVIRLATLRYLFLPVYTQWWVRQTSPNIFAILLFLYITQMINWAVYTFNIHRLEHNGDDCSKTIANSTILIQDSKTADKQVEEHMVSLSELLIPMSLSFLLSLIHSQIVATNTATGGKAKRRRFSNTSQNGKHIRGEPRVRRRKKLVKMRSQDFIDTSLPHRKAQVFKNTITKVPLESIIEASAVIHTTSSPSTNAIRDSNRETFHTASAIIKNSYHDVAPPIKHKFDLNHLDMPHKTAFDCRGTDYFNNNPSDLVHKKRNVNWHSTIDNFATETQEKQQQTSPQCMTSTTTSENNSPNTTGVVIRDALVNDNNPSSSSPIKIVRFDQCVQEFYDDLINRTDLLTITTSNSHSDNINPNPCTISCVSARRIIGEDDGFESFNGKSSSGEDTNSPLPTTSSAMTVKNQLRLRLNAIDYQNGRVEDGQRKEANSKLPPAVCRRKMPPSSESDNGFNHGIVSSCDAYQQTKKTKSRSVEASSGETDEDGDEGEIISSPASIGNISNYNECTTSATEWLGVTTNSEECSYSSELDNSDDFKNHRLSDEDYDMEFTPAIILNSHSTTDRISCTIWDQREIKKAQMSVLEISSCIIERVESMPETNDYIYIGIFFSFWLSLIPSFCRLCEVTIDSDKPSEINYFDVPMLLWEKASFSFSTIFRFAFGHSQWDQTILIIGFVQRLCLTSILFIIFAVAERTFKQKFLYGKLFSHVTSSRRARKSNLPHFRLNKVRNIKTWLSVRSYLKKRGPQRSVDVIVSAAFIVTLLLLAFLSVEFLSDSVHLHSHLNLEALMWSTTIGIFLLRFMTLGNKIHHKYRSVSVLITEQINLYLQIEQKPKKKEELMVSNSVLKLAADLLKELESPFKISGLSANPYLFTTIKVVILSALSGVLSEMLGFKLKLHKIKIK